MIQRNFKFLFLYCFFLVSCLDSDNNDILVKVYEDELSMDHILNNLPEDMLDTSFFLERYQDKWVRTKLMEHHANINLNDDLKDYEKQVDEYRSSLLIFEYQQQLVHQNFDTNITDQEIKEYYAKYKENFKLHKNIFKGKFIMFENDAPKQERLLSIFNSKNLYEQDELLEYCQQFAEKYYLKDSIWNYFSFFSNHFPEYLISNEEQFLNQTNFLEFRYKNYKCILFIKDYQLKGFISPLSLEYDKIRMVILNKNKLAYLKTVEDKLYQQAISSGKIKYY